MKMRFKVSLFIAVFALILTAFAYADTDVVVPGEPPITTHAVDCHIRLLEFVLETRMTVAQKNYFLEAIKEECAEMTAEEKGGFLEAVLLVDSMSEMDEPQQETIQKVLEKDFTESAVELPDDPAAQLFLKLKNESFKVVITNGDDDITQQSLDAFAEYVAFLAQPDKPVWLDAATNSALQKSIVENFLKFTPEEKASLNDFHFTWFMIRAAWQGSVAAKQKDGWRKKLAAVGIKAGEIPDMTRIKAALATDLYGELLDECAKIGVDSSEWSTGTTFKVW